ncbi:MAG: hypothetical protein ACJAXD_001923 [Cryomorphaceae bacterium]|jgi:hypothetical protein
MRRSIAILLLCLTPLFLSAQENPDPYVISIVDDDPNYAQFMAHLSVGLETDFQFRTEVPLRAGVRYELEEKPWAFETSIIVSLFGDRKNSFYPDNLSQNEFQAYSNFEIGGAYNFSDRSSVEPIAVTIEKKWRRRASGNEELTE